MYSIESLISILKSGATSNNSLDEVDDILNRIAAGVSIPNSKRTVLYDLVMRLKHKSHWRIKEEATKVAEKIKRERLTEARSFYVEYNEDVRHVESSIDPNHEVVTTLVTPGTVLYQWCKMIETEDGEVTLYDSQKDICTIGKYFSTTQVSPDSLGFFRAFDLHNTNGIFEGIAQQVCCRFVFQFSAPCLVSTAKGTFDNWNVHHHYDGTAINKEETIGDIKINKEPYKGIWAYGGAEQVFVPLSDEQRKELAQTAQFV